MTPVEYFIHEYADSLNHYSGGRLPFFLQDADFDEKYSIIYSAEILPLRKRIFEQVINCEVLQAIGIQQSKFDKKPKNESNLSIFEIAQRRSEILNCK